MSDSTTIDWFRKPAGSAADGTLNACYNALDRHVVRGRAEDPALCAGGRSWTYAEMLTHVGAFAGVLRAFGTGPGDPVAVSPLPTFEGAIVTLAAARLGAVVEHAADLAPHLSAARVLVAPSDPGLDSGDVPVITLDDSRELSWAVVMRAGRTDPAGCADVAGDAVLARAEGCELTVLAALDHPVAPRVGPPPGARVLEVGGLGIWSYDAAQAAR